MGAGACAIACDPPGHTGRDRVAGRACPRWRRGRVAAALLLALLLAPSVALGQEIITFTRPDGGLSIVNPAPACLRQLQRPVGTPTRPNECPPLGLTRAQAVQWVRQKDVPATATDVVIHPDRSALPATRGLRDAWRKSGSVVTVDLPAARRVRARQVLAVIDKKIAKSLTDTRRAEDEANTVLQGQLVTYRNSLRTIRAAVATDLATVTTPDAIEAWTPVYPADPGPGQ